MKNTFLFLLALLGTISSTNSQEVVSAEYLISYNQEYFATELGVTFSQNGVDLYRFLYTTTDLKGLQDTASGLVVIPQVEDVAFPVVSYSHGTVGSRFDVPSFLSFEHALPAIYGSMGTVCIAADYLGLGDSRGIHPYVHADSEAWASHDLLLAIKDFLPDDFDVNLNDQLYITGYSQGGHAAMALHRYLETETETEVSASFPMSGPYSISSGMRDLFLTDQEYTIVAYLAATAISYQEAYGTIYPNGDIHQLFKAPYADIILKYVNEEEDLFAINEELISNLIANEGGAFAKKMIFDDIVDAVLVDENHPINVALRDNDVYDWAPKADTRLIYCTADEQVAYQNSLIAEQKMTENGSTTVSAIDVNPLANHTECVTPAATNFVFFLLLNATTTSTSELSNLSASIYPNPSSGIFNISLKDMSYGNANIYNMQGQLMKNIKITNPTQQVSLDVEKGMYIITISDQNGRSIKTERLIVY